MARIAVKENGQEEEIEVIDIFDDGKIYAWHGEYVYTVMYTYRDGEGYRYIIIYPEDEVIAKSDAYDDYDDMRADAIWAYTSCEGEAEYETEKEELRNEIRRIDEEQLYELNPYIPEVQGLRDMLVLLKEGN